MITGGPGVGKTTMIRELQAAGYSCVQEVAREVICEQLEQGGDGLPWENVPKYTLLMLQKSMSSYKNALQLEPGPVFFDRGLPDSIAYARIAGIPIAPELDLAARTLRYSNPVFMLPPWPEIYLQDTERRESFEHAVLIYEMLKSVFHDYGYHLIEIPPATVADRVHFMLQFIWNTT